VALRVLCLTSLLAGSVAAQAPEDARPPAEAPPQEEAPDLDVRIGGDYRLRLNLQSDIPLAPLPSEPETPDLGQNVWGQQWLRLRGALTLRDPRLRVVGEADLLFGVAFGDLAVGVAPAAFARDAYGYPGLRLRQLYVEWADHFGRLQVGQTAFHWGLGIVSNDGGRAPPFGDALFGDLVRRVLFEGTPGGPDSPVSLALAFDWVAYDLIADFERRGEVALRGLAAVRLTLAPDRQAGAYIAYRHQENDLGEGLEVFVADAFLTWTFPEASGGKILTAFEGAYVFGRASAFRTVERPEDDVRQLLWGAQLGRLARHVDVILEGGFTSGDANPTDGAQRRAVMDPDHRVGMILFPEVLAWQTARSAAIGQSPALFARPGRGTERLPTNGGVAGAFYVFPYATWKPLEELQLRAGGVLAFASTDVVDPFQQIALSQQRNYRGGDPGARDLGLEVDLAVLTRLEIAAGVVFSGGVEGAVFFPGQAFADALGQRFGPVGLARLRVGVSY
jgi:hypothetical protein